MSIYYQYLLYTLGVSTFAALCTMLGSAFVFFFSKHSPRLSSLLLSFAAGVMIAGSFFSLLLPAIALTNEHGYSLALMIGLGCVLGFAFMLVCHIIMSKLDDKNAFSPKLLALSITLHNIPEGMCVGVAFASALLSPAFIPVSIALGIGIAFQNIPEGASISLPLFAAGRSKARSFRAGTLSGVVEPISAVLAYVFSSLLLPILPLLLSFAAACMLYVSVVQLAPESMALDSRLAPLGLSLGFILMLMLDILL